RGRRAFPRSAPQVQRRTISQQRRCRASKRTAAFFRHAFRTEDDCMRTISRTTMGFATLVATLLGIQTALAGELKLEKDELKLGFIKLTDMAPLAVAYELGYFEDEGLFVTLEPQANWKVLLDRV